MSIRSELESWAPTEIILKDWVTNISGDPLVAGLGQVVDNHYEERKLVVDPYLGVSLVGDEVTVDFTASGLRAEVFSLISNKNNEVEEW